MTARRGYFCRRDVVKATLGGLGLILGRPSSASPQQTWSRQDALYQDTPKNGQSCGLCTLFRPPDGCQVIEGPVSRTGWCKFFDMID